MMPATRSKVCTIQTGELVRCTPLETPVDFLLDFYFGQAQIIYG
jgi:hypothetical protein